MKGYLRKQVANKTDVNIETLRYYEKIQLINPPERTEKGYRIYPEETITKINFIKSAKESGFTLEEIKTLLQISENKSPNLNDVSQLLDHKIEDMQSKIYTLEKMKETLAKVRLNLKSSNTCPVIKTYLQNF